MEYEHIITISERLADFQGRSLATISNKCVGHARLFTRLKSGHGCNVKTFKIAMAWLSNHWPEDLEWPSDIPRPTSCAA